MRSLCQSRTRLSVRPTMGFFKKLFGSNAQPPVSARGSGKQLLRPRGGGTKAPKWESRGLTPNLHAVARGGPYHRGLQHDHRQAAQAVLQVGPGVLKAQELGASEE